MSLPVHRAQERAREALLDALTGGTPTLDAPGRTQLVKMVLHPVQLEWDLLWREKALVPLAALRVVSLSEAEVRTVLASLDSRTPQAATAQALLSVPGRDQIVLDFVRACISGSWGPSAHLAPVLLGSTHRPLQELGVVVQSFPGRVDSSVRSRAILLLRGLSMPAFEVALTLASDAGLEGAPLSLESLEELASLLAP